MCTRMSINMPVCISFITWSQVLWHSCHQKVGVLVPSAWTKVGLWLFGPIVHCRSDTMWLPRLRYKRLFMKLLPCLLKNTCCWSPAPPWRKCDYHEAAMLWEIPNHMRRPCVGPPRTVPNSPGFTYVSEETFIRFHSAAIWVDPQMFKLSHMRSQGQAIPAMLAQVLDPQNPQT